MQKMAENTTQALPPVSGSATGVSYSWLTSTGAEVMIGWDAVNRDIATTSGSGYSCASPAEGLSDL